MWWTMIFWSYKHLQKLEPENSTYKFKVQTPQKWVDFELKITNFTENGGGYCDIYAKQFYA